MTANDGANTALGGRPFTRGGGSCVTDGKVVAPVVGVSRRKSAAGRSADKRRPPEGRCPSDRRWPRGSWPAAIAAQRCPPCPGAGRRTAARRPDPARRRRRRRSRSGSACATAATRPPRARVLQEVAPPAGDGGDGRLDGGPARGLVDQPGPRVFQVVKAVQLYEGGEAEEAVLIRGQVDGLRIGNRCGNTDRADIVQLPGGRICPLSAK